MLPPSRFVTQSDFKRWFNSLKALDELIFVCKKLGRIGFLNPGISNQVNAHRDLLENTIHHETPYFLCGVETVLDFELLADYEDKTVFNKFKHFWSAGTKFQSKVHRVAVANDVSFDQPRPSRIELEVTLLRVKALIPFEILKISFTEPMKKQTKLRGE